jgi:hypothetical protein
MGKMVHEDPILDINGIPERIPDIFYQRVPVIKTEPGTYQDWVRRGARPFKLVEAVKNEIQKIKLEVEKISWERKLRQRPPVSQDDVVFNRKIIEVLTGLSLDIQH